MRHQIRTQLAAFSLLELVIVIVVIGIVAAVAIPRLTRGAAGADESALAANLVVMNQAVELYTAEHGGTRPTSRDVGDQLTLYTDLQGRVSQTMGGQYIYGPYLRSFPIMPTGPHKGQTAISFQIGQYVAWVYDAQTGVITANTHDGAAAVSP